MNMLLSVIIAGYFAELYDHDGRITRPTAGHRRSSGKTGIRRREKRADSPIC